MKEFARLQRPFAALLISALILVSGCSSHQPQSTGSHVFGRAFVPEARNVLREGTTEGPELKLALEPSQSWQSLQDDALSRYERDRRAILAMVGEYRVSFDFMETAALQPGYELSRPYFSWGTEYIFVIESSEKEIELQHLLVMSHDGGEPIVVKHWRQEWRYEDPSRFEYLGKGRWERQEISNQEGRWTQTVFHVDDSPRYEAVGEWSHERGYSVFRTEEFSRPLPRREHSVRSDYNILRGEHEIFILPNGWLHQQTNAKTASRALAIELGLSRYERITGFDFSSGLEYWRKTERYWEAVREKWDQVMAENDRFLVKRRVGGKLQFFEHFLAAEVSSEMDDPAEAAHGIIKKYLETDEKGID